MIVAKVIWAQQEREVLLETAMVIWSQPLLNFMVIASIILQELGRSEKVLTCVRMPICLMWSGVGLIADYEYTQRKT